MPPKRRNPPVERVAAEEVSDNVDLVQEILIRLPIKPLIRFEAICTQWQTLISDPEFARAHVWWNSKKSPTGFFFYDRRCTSISLKSIPLNQPASNQIGSIPLLDDFLYRTLSVVIQSCNGLLLCGRLSDPESYYVMNPTTGKYKVIPQPEDNSTESSITFGSLAYDPSVLIYYKIVHVCRSRKRGGKIQVYVYSSQNSSWKTVEQNLQTNWLVDLESGTYWNGSIYWASSRGNSVRFDVNSERLELYKMPRSNLAYSRCFGNSRDRLYMVILSHAYAQRFSVYEMCKDEGWNIVCTINVDHLTSAVILSGGGKVFPFSVICVLAGEVEMDSELVLRIPGKLIAYNYWKKTARALLDLTDDIKDPKKPTFNCVYPFIETLVPV